MPSLNRTQLMWLGGVLLVILGLLYLLGPILAPFLLAIILAYMCNPMVRKLSRFKMGRTIATLLVMALLLILFVAFLLILIPLFEKQIALFIQRLPGYLEWGRLHVAPWLSQTFGIDIQLDQATLTNFLSSHMENLRTVAEKFLPSLRTGTLAAVSFLTKLLLVPVVLFYVLRDWDGIVARLDELLPRRWGDEIRSIAHEIDEVLSAFLRGQISVMLLMSLFYWIGLSVAGLELALPIGLLTGLLGFVPYLGVTTGIVLGTLAALMQFQTLGGLIPVWVVFGLGQVVEGMALTPYLVGERIGLHPVAVIFALLAFGQVFGFFGVLLALPVSAALLVSFRHIRQAYLASDFYRL